MTAPNMDITRKDELAAWVKSVYRNAPQGETANDKKNLSDVLEIIKYGEIHIREGIVERVCRMAVDSQEWGGNDPDDGRWSLFYSMAKDAVSILDGRRGR